MLIHRGNEIGKGVTSYLISYTLQCLKTSPGIYYYYYYSSKNIKWWLISIKFQVMFQSYKFRREVLESPANYERAVRMIISRQKFTSGFV